MRISNIFGPNYLNIFEYRIIRSPLPETDGIFWEKKDRGNFWTFHPKKHFLQNSALANFNRICLFPGIRTEKIVPTFLLLSETPFKVHFTK